jgi:hypothetical protein
MCLEEQYSLHLWQGDVEFNNITHLCIRIPPSCTSIRNYKLPFCLPASTSRSQPLMACGTSQTHMPCQYWCKTRLEEKQNMGGIASICTQIKAFRRSLEGNMCISGLTVCVAGVLLF